MIMRMVRFGLVGASGVIVNMSVLALLYTLLSVPLMIAIALAIQSAIITNFIGHHVFTFRGRGKIGKRFASFEIISITTALVTWGVHNGVAFAFGTTPWWMVYAYNLIAIGTGFILNYTFNTTVTWADAEPERI